MADKEVGTEGGGWSVSERQSQHAAGAETLVREQFPVGAMFVVGVIAMGFVAVNVAALMLAIEPTHGFLLAEWGGLALPVVLYALWRGRGLASLRLVRPAVGDVLWMGPLAAGVAGMGLAVVIIQLTYWPPDPEYLVQFERAMTDITGDNLVWGLIIVAVTPGVCEELFFRGLVLSPLLRAMHPRTAIGVSALFFAALHFDPFRFFPQLFEGLVLGAVLWRTGSLAPAMLLHAGFNGLAFGLMGMAEIDPRAPEPTGDVITPLIIIIGVSTLLTIISLSALWRRSERRAVRLNSAVDERPRDAV